jgi:hypothetical protein
MTAANTITITAAATRCQNFQSVNIGGSLVVHLDDLSDTPGKAIAEFGPYLQKACDKVATEQLAAMFSTPVAPQFQPVVLERRPMPVPSEPSPVRRSEPLRMVEYSTAGDVPDEPEQEDRWPDHCPVCDSPFCQCEAGCQYGGRLAVAA